MIGTVQLSSEVSIKTNKPERTVQFNACLLGNQSYSTQWDFLLYVSMNKISAYMELLHVSIEINGALNIFKHFDWVIPQNNSSHKLCATVCL